MIMQVRKKERLPSPASSARIHLLKGEGGGEGEEKKKG